MNINRSHAVMMEMYPGQGTISLWALKPRPVWTLLKNYIHSVLMCYERQIVPTKEAYEEACTWSGEELSKEAFEEECMEKPFRLLFWSCGPTATDWNRVQFVGCDWSFSLEQVMKMLRNIIVRYRLHDEFDPDGFERYENRLRKEMEEERAEEQRYRNRSLPVLVSKEPKVLLSKEEIRQRYNVMVGLAKPTQTDVVFEAKYGFSPTEKKNYRVNLSGLEKSIKKSEGR